MEKVLIYAILSIVTIIGFFWYWGKTSGSLKEGGIVYEWWKNLRAEKKSKKENKKNKPKKK